MTLIKDNVIRKPTKKQMIAALNEFSNSKKYYWTSKYKSNEDGYIHGNAGEGKNLWEALLDDSSRSSSQSQSIFAQYADNQAQYYINHDDELREEHMPKYNYHVSIQIGEEGRKVYIDEVKAGNNKQAINKKIKDIKKEFKGIKYKIVAEHRKSDENMSEEEFEKLCYDRAYDNSNFIEGDIYEKDIDAEVAAYFWINFEIEEWDIEGVDWELNNVKAICKDCNFPLDEAAMTTTYEEFPECPNCRCDLRDVNTKVLDGI